MGLFSALVKTAINVVALPVAVAKDVVDVACGEEATNTERKLNQIKRESEEE